MTLAELTSEQILVTEIFVDWQLAGIEFIGLRDGIVAESFPRGTSAAVFDEARQRGIEVLAIDSDFDCITAAIVFTFGRTLELAMAEESPQ